MAEGLLLDSESSWSSPRPPWSPWSPWSAWSQWSSGVWDDRRSGARLGAPALWLGGGARHDHRHLRDDHQDHRSSSGFQYLINIIVNTVKDKHHQRHWWLMISFNYKRYLIRIINAGPRDAQWEGSPAESAWWKPHPGQNQFFFTIFWKVGENLILVENNSFSQFSEKLV